MHTSEMLHTVAEEEDGSYMRETAKFSTLKENLATWCRNGSIGAPPQGVTSLRGSNRIFVVDVGQPDEGTLLYRTGDQINVFNSAYAARRRTAHQTAAHEAERISGQCSTERVEAIERMTRAAAKDCTVLTRELTASHIAFNSMDAYLRGLHDAVHQGCIPVLRSDLPARYCPCSAQADQFLTDDLSKVTSTLSTLRTRPFIDYRRLILAQAGVIERTLLHSGYHNNRAIPAVKGALNSMGGICRYEHLQERIEELHWLLLLEHSTPDEITSRIDAIRAMVLVPLFPREARLLDPEDPLFIASAVRNDMAEALQRCGGHTEALRKTLKEPLPPLVESDMER